jgi:hypothetical protein
MSTLWDRRSTSNTRQNVVASVLLGLSTGILSQTGIATVLHVTPATKLPKRLRPAWVRKLSLAAAGGEMVGNAFVTSLPSRADPAPLAGRIVVGAGSAALLASTRKRPVAIAAILGAIAAAFSARAASGARARHVANIPDPLFALAENALAVVLAARATRK